MSARQHLQLNDDFAMQGGMLNRLTLAYETWGELNTLGDNAILLLPPVTVCSCGIKSDGSIGWLVGGYDRS